MARLTVQLNDQATQLVKDLARERTAATGEQTSETEILARALAFYDLAREYGPGGFTTSLFLPSKQVAEVQL